MFKTLKGTYYFSVLDDEGRSVILKVRFHDNNIEESEEITEIEMLKEQLATK